MTAIAALDTSFLRTSEHYAARARLASRVLATAACALAIAYAAAIIASDGELMLLVPLAAALVGVAVLARPIVGLYLLLGIALVFEQYAITGLQPITAQAWIFQNISAYTQVPLRLSVTDLLMLLTLASWGVRAAVSARTAPRIGPIGQAFVAFIALFAVGTVIGIARGSWSADAALSEIRGPTYMAVVYMLTVNLVKDRARIVAVAWIFVALVGFKGFEGILNYVESQSFAYSLEAVTSHEDVVFFDLAIALATVAIVLRIRSKLAYALIAIQPLLLAAELFSQRRIGFVALGAALFAMLLLSIAARPGRGLALAAVGAVLLGGYVLAFWGDSGPLGEPIRPLRAIFEPEAVTARDVASNHWRDIEDRNIEYTMRQVPLTGVGVGKPYILHEKPPTLAPAFIFWQYETHNALLWIWLKAGVLGAFVFWFLVARVLLVCSAGFRRARAPLLQWGFAVPIALLVIEVAFSTVDIGFTYNRTGIVFGIVLGLATVFVSTFRRRPIASPAMEAI